MRLQLPSFSRHVTQQPFVLATGLAAFVHSTWALGTLFAGKQPDAAFNWQFAGWIVPAALIAFALDVGQIATAAEIRAGQRTRGKYNTFIIFAIATYYLQWVYMANHMPALELAPGISDRWKDVPQIMQEAAIWIIPALLPLSTALYTLNSPDQVTKSASGEAASEPTNALIAAETTHFEQAVRGEVLDPTLFTATCPHCEWSQQYDTKQKASSALSAHQRACEYAIDYSSNGHH